MWTDWGEAPFCRWNVEARGPQRHTEARGLRIHASDYTARHKRQEHVPTALSVSPEPPWGRAALCPLSQAEWPVQWGTQAPAHHCLHVRNVFCDELAAQRHRLQEQNQVLSTESAGRLPTEPSAGSRGRDQTSPRGHKPGHWQRDTARAGSSPGPQVPQALFPPTRRHR